MLHLLLVEDDGDHAELIARMLRNGRVAHHIEHFSYGEAALRYLDGDDPHQDRPQPDVILLDLNLPRVSGLEILERLKQDDRHKSIPVVVLTSSAAETDRARAYQNHANSYLVKPVEFERFREMVRDLEMYWGAWNQPAPPEERRRDRRT